MIQINNQTKTLIKLFVGFLLLILIVRQLDLSLIVSTLSNFPIYFIALAVIAEWLAFWIDAKKQSLWLRRDGHKTTTLTVLKVRFTAAFINNIMPSSLASDLIRVSYLQKMTGSMESAWSSTIMARLQGLWGALLFLAVAIVFPGQSRLDISLLWTIILIFVSALTYFLIFSKPSIKIFSFFEKFALIQKPVSYFKKIHDRLYDYRKDYSLIIKGQILSFLFHLLSILVFLIICIGLRIGLSFKEIAVAVPSASLATMIPISINGIGVQDVSLVSILSKIEIKEMILSASLLWHVVRILGTTPGFFFFLKIKRELVKH